MAGFHTLFYIIFIVIIFSWISKYIKNEKSPIIATKAKLIKKTCSVSTSTDADGITFTDETFRLIFELDTGSQLKFAVSRQVYRNIPEYEYGMLTFQGTRFLKFQFKSGSVEK